MNESKNNEVYLMLQLHDHDMHFDIYTDVMSYLEKVLNNAGVPSDAYSIENFSDLCFTKESYEKYKNEIESLNEYFPIYCKSRLVNDEELTWNDYHLNIFKLEDANNDGTLNPDRYCVIVSLEWSDIETLPDGATGYSKF